MVRMGSGERPIGAAKGEQSDTEALCHPPHAGRQCEVQRDAGGCGAGKAPVAQSPMSHYGSSSLPSLRDPTVPYIWLKFPSHITVEGSNAADRLAEQGHMSHPRFLAPPIPAYQSPHFQTPKAPKAQRLSTTEFSPPQATALIFLPPPAPLSFYSSEAHET